MRKLATIRIIDDIKPIPDADAIECLVIDGWTVVSKKGEFQKGYLCVFFEIDSHLPADDFRFEFLKKTGIKVGTDGKERIRLKTIKLRKQLSQGLALPITQFPEIPATMFYPGTDVTELLDIIKYERPEPKTANAAGNFPDFIKKTDEERVQNIWKQLKAECSNILYVPTLKLDGSSCTVAFLAKDMQDIWTDKSADDQANGLDCFNDDGDKIGEIIVCSRNIQLKYDENSHFWKAVLKQELHYKLPEMTPNASYAIQGEVCGPGIQGNKEQFHDFEFYAFNLFSITSQKYITYRAAIELFSRHKVQSVPVLEDAFKVMERFTSLEDMLQYADGKSINAKRREGIVFKPWIRPLDSFKVISNKFLMSGGDD